MKFIHLADLHLGKSVKDFSMIEDQRYILRQITEITREEGADAVLISGDVYDRAVPSEEAVKLLDDFLFDLSKAGVRVLIISGNHDSDERLGFGARLFASSNIYFCTTYDGTLHKEVFEDEYGTVSFYMLPFVKASQVRHFFPEKEIGSYDEAVRTVIESAQIDENERNVILAHQFVAGKSKDTILGGSEGNSVKNVGLVECIGYDCFDPFDYVALGHIHKAQSIGRDEVRYAGTPLKYHSDEAGDEKSVPVITLGPKGQTDIELKALKPLRDMRCIKGTLKQLLSPENVINTDDYIFVTLTDEDVINDAMMIFRDIYPNTMQIRYENSHTKEIALTDISQMTEMRSFPELMKDFYMQMYQTPISDEEMEIMLKAAGEAGIIDEAG